MVQEAVQDRRRGRDVSQQLVPVLQGMVRGHHRGHRLAPSQDDLEEALAGTLGQLFDAHVIDDQKVRLQILGQHFVLPGEQQMGRT